MDTTKTVHEDLSVELAKLRAENEMLKAAAAAKAASRISCKVSEKGALSIYGMGRFPVTLYISQFDALDKAWPSVQAFVSAHRAEFQVKE